METVFISELKPLLDAIAEGMDLYVPRKADEHYVYSRYDPSNGTEVQLNNIRACTPVKEFLFPLRELAAVFPEAAEPEDVKPFAIMGLKDCDLRSMEILDKVFLENEFLDEFYQQRRENMFVISADCSEPAGSCCCTLFGGKPYSENGFDMNISRVDSGFVVEAASETARELIEKKKELFSQAEPQVLEERDSIRSATRKKLDESNAEYKLDGTVNEIIEQNEDSEVFDVESENCVECQACTRVCPTCHCFFLYDTKQKAYFKKMKMWDSCMRMSYAAVAGGANPRKVLGERIKHRLMHKFSYFLERYGVDMCVGCGRCIDADTHKMDIRKVLKKLSEEVKV